MGDVVMMWWGVINAVLSMHCPACPLTQRPIRPHPTEGHQLHMILCSINKCINAALCAAIIFDMLTIFVFLVFLNNLFSLVVQSIMVSSNFLFVYQSSDTLV